MQTEQGLRRLGLRFHNATHARVKVIERLYGMLQNDFQAQLGYVGRNPLTDKYEDTQKHKLAVERGAEHPSRFFLSKAQWRPILDAICLKSNETPLEGKYHAGRSPWEVYRSCFTTPLVKVPAEFRYLLASNRIETTVGRNGISFQYGRSRLTYKDHATGRLRGQKVFAWFNPERPETVACTDLAGENCFVVARETPVYNHDPLPGTLEKALAENAAHNSYQKELHRSLMPCYAGRLPANLFRPVLLDGGSLETARERNRLETEARAELTKAARNISASWRAAALLNITLSPAAQSRPETPAALARLGKFLDAPDEPEACDAANGESTR
jgi:hypothetical protein